MIKVLFSIFAKEKPAVKLTRKRSVIADILLSTSKEGREDALRALAQSKRESDRVVAAQLGTDEIRDVLAEDKSPRVRAMVARRGPEPLRFHLSFDEDDFVREQVAAYSNSRGLRDFMSLNDSCERVRDAAYRESDTHAMAVIYAGAGVRESDMPYQFR